MSVGAGLQAVVTFLAAHGATLAIGVSCVLLGGSLGLLLQRDPRARRTIGSWTALGLVVYLVLALVPMTRWSLPQWPANVAAVTVQPVVAKLIGPVAAPSLPEQPVVEAAPLSGLVPEELLATNEISVAPELAPVLPLLPTPELLAGVWLLGATLCAAWLLLGRLLLASLLRHTRSGPEDLAHAAGLPRRARLRLLDRPIAPFCCGLFRPSVVLHASLTAPERRNQALAVLRHEGAHLRQGDLRVQALFACLLPVLWWHPLYWLVRAQVRFCAEVLADAAAAGSCGLHGYVRELLDLAEDRALEGAAAPALSVFRRRPEFSRRIEMLLQRTLPWSPSPSFLRRCVQALTTSALVALSAGWFGVAPAPAQEPAPGPELRRENQQLQEEITRLRASLDALKARVAQLPDPAARSVDQDLLALTRLLQQAKPNVDPADGGLLGALIRDPEQQERIKDLFDKLKMQPAPQGPTTSGGARKSNTTVNKAQQAEVERINRLIRGAREERQSQEPEDVAIRSHEVKSGDTLESIVREVYGRGGNNAHALERMLAINPDLAPGNLRPGQQINLPPAAPAQDPVSAPRGSTNRWASGRTNDDPMSLLELATRTIHLRGEIEVAEVEAKRCVELVRRGLAGTGEVHAAEVRLRTAQKTLAVAQRLIEAEIESATDEVKELKAAQAAAQGEEVQRIERRLRLVSRRLEALVQAR